MGAVKVEVNETPGRVYGGRTGDERAAARRDALVAAAFSLVAEEGWRGVNIEAVCRRAALNKRYFYESFEGLDALYASTASFQEYRCGRSNTLPIQNEIRRFPRHRGSTR